MWYSLSGGALSSGGRGGRGRGGSSSCAGSSRGAGRGSGGSHGTSGGTCSPGGRRGRRIEAGVIRAGLNGERRVVDNVTVGAGQLDGDTGASLEVDVPRV